MTQYERLRKLLELAEDLDNAYLMRDYEGIQNLLFEVSEGLKGIDGMLSLHYYGRWQDWKEIKSDWLKEMHCDSIQENFSILSTRSRISEVIAELAAQN